LKSAFGPDRGPIGSAAGDVGVETGRIHSMSKRLAAALTLGFAVCASAYAAQSDAANVLEEVQTGIASYYGSRFEGRRTASGDTFRHDALTAAHPTLPFGTVVRVTNLAKGRFVDVRITDRLPSRRAIIDLTRKAAGQLNMLQAGRVKVTVQVLDWGKNHSHALRAAREMPAALLSAAAPEVFSAVAAEVMSAVASEDSR
jgi:rare lipoprotein A